MLFGFHSAATAKFGEWHKINLGIITRTAQFLFDFSIYFSAKFDGNSSVFVGRCNKSKSGSIFMYYLLSRDSRLCISG